MSPIVPRLAALVLGLLGPPAVAADSPATAAVSVEALDVFDEPDQRSVASGLLRRGDEVVVRAAGPEGWLKIDPPPGAFRWIDQTMLRFSDDATEAEVMVARAPVRSGIAGARMVGAPRGSLTLGTKVRLLDRPPLRIGQGAGARTWRAIATTSGEVRYIRAEGVERTGAPPPPAREAQAVFREERPPAPLPNPPPEIAVELAQIDADRRAVLRQPIEMWNLASVRTRYEALLKRSTDPAAGPAIRARIDRVARDDEAAKAARTIESILERSKQRDRSLTLALRRLAAAEQPQARPYDYQGMIQASSRKVDGQRVFALIGPEGTTVAYLNLPAGLNPAPLIARKVGVRGTVHYDENLRARLIAVDDLDPLDDDR